MGEKGKSCGMHLHGLSFEKWVTIKGLFSAGKPEISGIRHRNSYVSRDQMDLTLDGFR